MASWKYILYCQGPFCGKKKRTRISANNVMKKYCDPCRAEVIRRYKNKVNRGENRKAYMKKWRDKNRYHLQYYQAKWRREKKAKEKAGED